MAEVEFGCAVLPTRDPAELVRLAGLVEEAGYDRLWVPDQTFLADPFLLLGRVAERTSLDLGIALTNPFSRHPVQIARSMATLVELDSLRERDWVLGLGKGNSDLVLRPLGVDDDSGVARLAAAVRIVRSLLAGETVEPDDTGFLTRAVALETLPAACRVFVGTRGPQTLRLAGAAADGILTESLFRPELVRWARSLLPADGRARPHVAWQSVMVLDEGQAIPEHVRDFAALLMRTTAAAVLELLGVAPETRAKISARALTSSDVTDDDVRRFVAVGTPEELQAIVLAAVEAGATSWGSIFVGGVDALDTGIRRFAAEVMEPVRATLAPHREDTL